MSGQGTSVCLALIHNNDALRNQSIQPRLETLRTSLSRNYQARMLEISFQSEIKPHATPMVLLRDAIYQVLDRGWRRYRLIESGLFPLNVAMARETLKKYFRRDDGWKRNSSIEMVVTDKHIRVWKSFLDTKADFLICFEDDAVFRDDSVERVNDLFDTLSRADFNRPIYIDLAGGLTFQELGIDKLETRRDAYFRHFSKPVTNTACVYLMNRRLAAVFYERITRRPWLRLIAIDWMMNKLFMQLTVNGLDCLCMHADPTIFKHGTATGEFVSWQTKMPH